jgi:hypothetical protein
MADFLWGTRAAAMSGAPAQTLPVWRLLFASNHLSPTARGLALLYMGNAYLWSCRQHDAIEVLSRSAAIFKEGRQYEMLDLALATQSVAALQTLDYELARRNIANVKDRFWHHNLTGLYQWNLFDLESARASFLELDRNFVSDDPGTKLQNLGNLTLLNVAIGDIARSRVLAVEVGELRPQVMSSRLIMVSDQIDALHNRLNGNTGTSLSILESCIERIRLENHVWPSIHDDACECLLSLGDVPRALDHFVEAAQIRRKAAVGLSQPVLERNSRLRKRFVACLGTEGYRLELKRRTLESQPKSISR